jgi:hypothetical protein
MIKQLRNIRIFAVNFYKKFLSWIFHHNIITINKFFKRIKKNLILIFKKKDMRKKIYYKRSYNFKKK